jgi:hypothetical protein
MKHYILATFSLVWVFFLVVGTVCLLDLSDKYLWFNVFPWGLLLLGLILVLIYNLIFNRESFK